jgi:hypothetical protein
MASHFLAFQEIVFSFPITHRKLLKVHTIIMVLFVKYDDDDDDDDDEEEEEEEEGIVLYLGL